MYQINEGIFHQSYFCICEGTLKTEKSKLMFSSISYDPNLFILLYSIILYLSRWGVASVNRPLQQQQNKYLLRK